MAPRLRDEVHRVGVLIGRHRQGEALVDRTVGEPVELDPRRLEHGETLLGGEGVGLLHPVVGLEIELHVQRLAGHARAERLDDGVATDDELGAVLAGAHRGAAAGAGARCGRLLRDRLLLLGRARRLLGLGVLGALDRGRCRPLGLETTTSLAAGADRRALLGPGLAHRALALGVAGHQTSFVVSSDQREPPAVSSTTIPAILS
jgi:hypothetical protein